MRINTFKECLLTSTICAGSLLLATPAAAQDRPAVQTPVTEEDAAIVVTGSRIARRDLTSASPVAVVTDEEFKLSGTVNVEQVLNTLPQVIPGTTAFSNNPGGGFTTVDLRALGSQRTLVLVNGRRWMFFDTSQRVDLNTIPAFLLDTVDVVTGGASAIYGSDAIGGVINFNLRHNLDGIEAGAQYGITEMGDAARFNANVAIGTQFADGRGSVTLYADYLKRNPLFAGARKETRFAYGDLGTPPQLVPQGSFTVPQGRVSAPAQVVIAAGNSLPQVTLNLATGNFGSTNGAFFGTAGVSTAFRDPEDSYNFAPANYLQVPQQRILLGAYGDYDVTDNITAYMELTFANNRVPNELAATPVTGTIPVNIAQNASHLSASDLAALQQLDANETIISAAVTARGLNPALLFGTATAPGIVNLSVFRRLTETGSRHTNFDTASYRALLGLRGDITDNFSYDAYYSYARSQITNIQDGNISKSAFNAGVLNGSVNVFGPNTISPAALQAISIIATNTTESVLQVASGSVSGSLFNLGWGAEDVGVAVGAEYRKMSSRFVPDTALSSGDVIGFNAAKPIRGSYDVKEAFAEVRIPIVADRPFMQLLELTGAARYSKYSLGAVGGVWTYAAGAKWAPVRDIMFRGNYQRAVRAPNVGELFAGGGQNFVGAIDPCGSRGTAASQTATLRQLCINSGVPAALVFSGSIQPNAQIEAATGGNPNLQEEVSDSYTAGVVLRPRFIPRLNITVDYYRIKVQNAIGQAAGGANNILNLCYNVIQNLSNPICSFVHRNPTTGSIQSPYVIEAGNVNLASFDTAGVDIQVDYSQPLNFGLASAQSKLDATFLATYTDKFDTVAVPGLASSLAQCADKFGNLNCGTPTARWKWNSRLSWIDGPLTTSMRWRHLSNTTDDNPGKIFVVETIPAYDVFDLAFAFDLTESFNITAGVNNILDRKPPVLGGNSQQASTYPGQFDVLGRDFFIAAKIKL